MSLLAWFGGHLMIGQRLPLVPEPLSPPTFAMELRGGGG